MQLSSQEMMDNADLFAEDVERVKALPPEAISELRDYLKNLLAGNKPEDPACIWLKKQTMRCRYHEHRPMICRDFEVGSEDCLAWRHQYNVDS